MDPITDVPFLSLMVLVPLAGALLTLLMGGNRASKAKFVAALFSLAGIPPLAGFTSKFILFSSAIYVNGAIDTQWLWLILVAVLNSAMSLYYYARVVKAMYIEEGESTEKVKLGKAFTLAILLCVIGVIVLGVYPEPLLKLCESAAIALLG